MTTLVPDGDRIRALRAAEGMTQAQLARAAHVDVKTVHRAERTEAPLRRETLRDLATALATSVEHLIGRDERSTAVAAPNENEGHGSLLLRRVEEAHRFYDTARHCEVYSWRFEIDPDEAGAPLIAEWMAIVRRAVEGAGHVEDAFDAEGEFAALHRVARLKTLLEALSHRGIAVLANQYVAVRRRPDGGSEAGARVLRIVFGDGRLRRMREFIDRSEVEEERPQRPIAAVAASPTPEASDRSRVLERVGSIDLRTQSNSVVAALGLALETIGAPIPYETLMAASGAAFRLQVAQPALCPSTPFALAGFDLTPALSHAIGREIRWIAPESEAPDPMAARRQAVCESLDRGVPVLYAAEECALIVGYHRGGAHFSVRSYFDPGDAYGVLDRWNWPSPGVLGAPRTMPEPLEWLASAARMAGTLARCGERFREPGGSDCRVGFAAFDAWTEFLSDDARFDSLDARAARAQLHANGWSYASLVDARRAAARFLEGFRAPLPGEAQHRLDAAVEIYAAIADVLAAGWSHVPTAKTEFAPDHDAVNLAPEPAAPWLAKQRHAQARTLAHVLALEREGVEALDALSAALSEAGQG